MKIPFACSPGNDVKIDLLTPAWTLLSPRKMAAIDNNKTPNYDEYPTIIYAYINRYVYIFIFTATSLLIVLAAESSCPLDEDKKTIRRINVITPIC